MSRKESALSITGDPAKESKSSFQPERTKLKVKRIYQFDPQDSLSGGQSERLLDTTKPAVQNPNPPKQTKRFALAYKHKLELSSDDHVSWEPGGEETLTNKKVRGNPPSSPLRTDIMKDVSKTNDPVTSLVCKYDTSLENISGTQTPSKKSSYSILEPDLKDASVQLLTDLSDARSTPYKVPRPKNSRLADASRFRNGDRSILPEAALDGDTRTGRQTEISLSDMPSDDSFSDELDMDELDHVLKITQKEPSFEQQNTAEESDEFMSDSFLSEEEDDELDELIDRLETQRSNQLTSNTYTTSDRNHAQIFRNNMEKQDAPIAAVKNNSNLAKSSLNKAGVHRFQIKKVDASSYIDTGKTKEQKILTVLTKDDRLRKVVVRDMWAQLAFAEDDIIHVIGSEPSLVDKDKNLLIWNPDILLSATTVGDSLNCERRSVLKSRLAFPGESSLPLLVGVAVHLIFQTCLTTGDTSNTFIDNTVDLELDSRLLEILSIGLTKAQVKEQIMQHVPYVQEWCKLYVSEGSAEVKDFCQRMSHEKLSVREIVDVEENIWSPMFGLRGLIDVTLETCFQILDGSRADVLITPMEIKTGAREQLEHRAQASLYTLLANDRYGVNTDSFLLVYSKLKETQRHKIGLTDLKHLLNLRNSVSQYIRQSVRALPDLKRQSICDRCPVVASCMTINKLTENGQSESSGLPEGMYDDLTSQVNIPVDSAFFSHWDDLLTKEESIVKAAQKELWIHSSEYRERNGGKAIGNLAVKEAHDVKSNGVFVYVLERSTTSSGQASLQNSQLQKNDRVIISDEEGHFALSSGWIESIRPSFITVKTHRKIINSSLEKPGFDRERNQVFHSVVRDTATSTEIPSQVKAKRFRVDKDDMFHGLALARFNILNLFLPESGDHLRRRMVVDLAKPRFGAPIFDIDAKLHVSKDKFNPDQMLAFSKVLRSRDYSLVLGMPGTGKSTVIAQLIKFLVEAGKSVLLASYTHSAVDNILIKLLDSDIRILRTGNPNRVHQLVRKFVPLCQGSCHKLETAQDFHGVYVNTPIVATTCLGISDIAFGQGRTFDYCIIDEASQVSMPVCLGPLRFCEKFVLVGDHFQLPPLVLSPEARAGGLDQSLFKTLSEKHPESVVQLRYQYRMCADIMLLSNTLIYENRLMCGNEDVANQVLKVPHPAKIDNLLIDNHVDASKRWMESILCEKNRVLFLNHDNLPAFEKANGEKIENPLEAELVKQIVDGLIFCGVEEKSIGVMSLYRAQLRLLHRNLSTRSNVEILTADQFQGRDKDCIIISMVRSNERNSVGDLLKEWRRINVAITRARSKLIILGSKSTLKNLNTLDAFMGMIQVRGWMYDLPRSANLVYRSLLNASQQSPQKGFKKNGILGSASLQKSQVARNILDDLK